MVEGVDTTELVAAGDTEVADVVEVVVGVEIALSTVVLPVVDGVVETVPLELTVGVTEPTVVVDEALELVVVVVAVVVLELVVVGTTYFRAYACA